MLAINDGFGSRREFLRVGGLTLGGLALPMLLPGRGWASSESVVAGKSVIFLFLHGGPSQIETFDPKMNAPAEVRSATGEVATRTAGVTFGGSFQKLAQRSDKLTVVRSFVTGDGNHDIKPVVGRDTLGANLGSIYAHMAGLNHPATGMPTNAALFPRAVDSTTQAPTSNFGNFSATGPLSAACAPFVPGSGGSAQEDMKLKLPLDRLEDRRRLLAGLDCANRALDAAANAGLDEQRDKAFRIIQGGESEAFD